MSYRPPSYSDQDVTPKYEPNEHHDLEGFLEAYRQKQNIKFINEQRECEVNKDIQNKKNSQNQKCVCSIQ